jgi:hypothetical protein
MASKTIYCGRFVSAPKPGPDSALEIKEGAVLVSYSLPSLPRQLSDVSSSICGPGEARTPIATTAAVATAAGGGSDEAAGRAGAEKVSGEGVIERVDWTVASPEEARQKFGVGVDEAEVVNCKRGGFFFPGFVGESAFKFGLLLILGFGDIRVLQQFKDVWMCCFVRFGLVWGRACETAGKQGSWLEVCRS